MNRINDLRTNYRSISQNDAFWQEIHDNFVRASRVAIGAVIETVRSQAPRLSDTLAQWVHNIEYDRLMALIAPDAPCQA